MRPTSRSSVTTWMAPSTRASTVTASCSPTSGIARRSRTYTFRPTAGSSRLVPPLAAGGWRTSPSLDTTPTAHLTIRSMSMACGRSSSAASTLLSQARSRLTTASWRPDSRPRTASSTSQSPGSTPAGTPDPGFGVSGRLTTDIQDLDAGEQVTTLPGGQILVAGGASTGGATDTAMVRYASDGSLDSTFGAAGIVIRDFGVVSDGSSAMALQPDGKILVQAGSGFNLARFNANGSTDLRFGVDGVATVEVGGNSRAGALALQSNGSIIEAGLTDTGAAPDNFGLVRIAGGEPDPGPDPPDPGPRPTCQGKPANVVAVAGVTTNGTPNDDVIVGTPGRDRIKAGAGRDIICALAGRSKVKAGTGCRHRRRRQPPRCDSRRRGRGRSSRQASERPLVRKRRCRPSRRR